MTYDEVVPAPAGMSPEDPQVRVLGHCGPRTRGDEPTVVTTAVPQGTWSPHPRG